MPPTGLSFQRLVKEEQRDGGRVQLKDLIRDKSSVARRVFLEGVEKDKGGRIRGGWAVPENRSECPCTSFFRRRKQYVVCALLQGLQGSFSSCIPGEEFFEVHECLQRWCRNKT